MISCHYLVHRGSRIHLKFWIVFISHIQFVPFDYKETLLPPCQSIAWWVMSLEQTCKEKVQTRPHREVQWAQLSCGNEQSYQEGRLGTWTTWFLWTKLRPGLKEYNRVENELRVTCLILHQEGSLLPSDAWYLLRLGGNETPCFRILSAHTNRDAESGSYTVPRFWLSLGQQTPCLDSPIPSCQKTGNTSRYWGLWEGGNMKRGS